MLRASNRRRAASVFKLSDDPGGIPPRRRRQRLNSGLYDYDGPNPRFLPSDPESHPMRPSFRGLMLPAAFAGSLLAPALDIRAQDSPRDAAKAPEAPEAPAVDLLEGLRDGRLGVEAKGGDKGQMTVTVKNLTRKPLRVVLPPGLVAQGAVGQFGGGGMGGGGGGMGGGGMGGGMGGGGMGGGGTMPASRGMIMLGQLIMNLVAPDTWDRTTLNSGMMGGGMGGGGGGMGGGGMGGGGMGGGGMGGGMRSVPPVGAPTATLAPGQTRNLSTPVVSLSPPSEDARIVLPTKDEPLELGLIGQLSDDPRVQATLVRLSKTAAPANVAQLAMWRVGSNLGWDQIARLHKSFGGNAGEVALAKALVAQVDAGNLPEAESASIYWDVTAADAEGEALAAEIRTMLDGKSVLGLTARAGMPDRSEGSALAVRVKVAGKTAAVQLSTAEGPAAAWTPLAKFSVPTTKADGARRKAYEVADAATEEVVGRLVRVQLIKDKARDKKGNEQYKIRIDNTSPLILNGVALVGTKAGDKPTGMAGFSLPPHRVLTVPATGEVVQRLGLKDGIKVLAADLSGL